MTREERLRFCKLCKNRKMDFQQGLLCNLTGKHADFEGSCSKFYPDDANTISSPGNRSRESYAKTESDRPAWRTVVSVIIFIIAIVRLIALFMR